MIEKWLSLIFATFVLTTSACGQASTNVVTKTEDKSTGPLLGKVLFSQESISIMLCDGKRSTCDMPNTQEEIERRYCNLTFSEDGVRAFKQFPIVRSDKDGIFGAYWITGTGSRSRESGPFGHLGRYGCEVRFDDVSDVDVGPPYFFDIPTPEDAERSRTYKAAKERRTDR
jgi:hypothetical protein